MCSVGAGVSLWGGVESKSASCTAQLSSEVEESLSALSQGAAAAALSTQTPRVSLHREKGYGAAPCRACWREESALTAGICPGIHGLVAGKSEMMREQLG